VFQFKFYFVIKDLSCSKRLMYWNIMCL
jgi:hypothetical protein